jgi:uncharacterized membrane protein (Fun14 family)
MKSNMFGRLGLGRRNNTTSSNAEQTFWVIIPSNVRPGGQFQVSAGGRVMRVNCPVDSMPGDTMHFTVRDNVPVTQSNEDNGNPENSSRSINGGGIDGGSNPPSLPLDSAPPSPPSKTLSEGQPSQQQTGKTNRFEVVVPMGVIPGHPFTLLAGGMRVLVTCPKNAQPGQKIRFNLPVGLLNRPDGPKSKLAEIKLSYDKDGWTRCIRPEDMKFQWTRFDERGNVDERTRFDADRSAYVLKLDYLDNNDRLLRSGRCSLVTAERGADADMPDPYAPTNDGGECSKIGAILAPYKPIISKLTISSVMGYCSAITAKRLGKGIAFIAGLGFIALQGMVYGGFVTVDWKKVEKSAVDAIDTVSSFSSSTIVVFRWDLFDHFRVG